MRILSRIVPAEYGSDLSLDDGTHFEDGQAHHKKTLEHRGFLHYGVSPQSTVYALTDGKQPAAICSEGGNR